MLCRTVLSAHNPSSISRNEKRTPADSVKVTFIARFLLSPGRYAFGAWLASSPARVAIWAGIAGSAQPYMCRHLS